MRSLLVRPHRPDADCVLFVDAARSARALCSGTNAPSTDERWAQHVLRRCRERLVHLAACGARPGPLRPQLVHEVDLVGCACVRVRRAVEVSTRTRTTKHWLHCLQRQASR